MTQTFRHYEIIGVVLLIVGLGIVCAGCTTHAPINQTNISTNTSIYTSGGQITPTPQPTPNPYGLDSDGYYIADMVSRFERPPPGKILLGPDFSHDELSTKVPGNPPPGGWHFNVTLKERNITSGDSLLFDGTTNLPKDTLVGADIFNDMYGLQQHFIAPVLPGVNGTNIIKVKIPAMDIHIDRYCDNEFGKSLETEFLKNGTYTTDIIFSSFSEEINIRSDPAHPMIIEQNACQSNHHGARGCNKTNVWTWTNNTSTQRVWESDDPLYENGTIKPYPTHPRPYKTCLKRTADNSTDVLTIC